jgi:hypothetical protein
MYLAARYACSLIAMIRGIPLAAVLSVLGLANVVQGEECLTVKAGIAHEIGRLKSDGREKSYCVLRSCGSDDESHDQAFGARHGHSRQCYISS